MIDALTALSPEQLLVLCLIVFAFGIWALNQKADR